MEANQIIHGDCLEVMRGMSSDFVDLVFDSPPYEAARTYGIGFRLRGQAWVDWMVERTVEALRICKGPVITVVEGQARDFRWSATPALLMADLHRRGIHLRKPPIYHRFSFPGSGGPDWLRNDYEFIVCCTRGGRLPWSDNTAMGKPPKFKPGGAMSHRTADGTRVGKKMTLKRSKLNSDRGGGRSTDGEYSWTYVPPKVANPGNVIRCTVGGGRMGHELASENEAPFPESLAEFFVRSFCPPNGIVLDRFCGSGTTPSVAQKWNRRFIGIDIRESQVELARRRLATVQIRVDCLTTPRPKPQGAKHE
jgi:hypothetical protein